MKTRLVLLTTVLFALTTLGYGQVKSDTLLYEVETKDGNTYQGYLIEQDETYVILETQNIGRITLQRVDIKKMVEINSSQIKEDGKYWSDNPQATRYLWQPNGYGLKKGEAYYQNIWVFWNHVSFGLSDNFSMGFGIIPLFLFAGAPSPVWITPRVSIPIVENKFNLGGGALIGTVLGAEQAGFGITYGVATIGSKDYNASLGLGYGYAGGDWSSRPIITGSAMLRLSQKAYFITENYFLDEVILLSFGTRFILKKVGIDASLIVPSETGGETIFFPLLGLTIPFGNTQGNLSR